MMTHSHELPAYIREIPEVLNLEQRIETTVVDALDPEYSYKNRATTDEVLRLVEELPAIEKHAIEAKIGELSCISLAQVLEKRYYQSKYHDRTSRDRRALEQVPVVSYWKKFYPLLPILMSM